jgi:nicotinate-nucleotide adenylyltransferase
VRIGVYGGSFNPPHVGHAMVAGWLRWTDRVDAVLLVPTFAHAFGKTLAPFELRVRMCEALCVDLGPWAGVSRIEAELGGTSYTVRTLDALTRARPDDRLQLVIGADVLPQTPLWREWERIAREYAPIVVGRAGHPPVTDAPDFPSVSSTDIRERLSNGGPVDHLVPASVRRVIHAAGNPYAT